MPKFRTEFFLNNASYVAVVRKSQFSPCLQQTLDLAGKKNYNHSIMDNQSTLFLLLNASVVWFVVAAVLMKLCRLKSFVLVIIIAPFIIGSTFRHIAGMPQLIGFYGTSILYGSLGIVLGIVYVDYARVKARFQKASKISFVARGIIAFSSLYLLSFFGQKIIVNNPMVQFALSWIDGGEKATELLSQVDYNGALTAGAGIVGGFSIIALSRYLDYRSTNKLPNIENQLENK